MIEKREKIQNNPMQVSNHHKCVIVEQAKIDYFQLNGKKAGMAAS